MSSGICLLLSGGMDSATCLWWLKERHDGPIHTISIDYRQRHRIELECARDLAARAGVKAHKCIELDLSTIGGIPLIDERLEVPTARQQRQIATVVPMRNMLFVTAAAAYAETQGIYELALAPVKDDYRSYRDCRRPFYDALEKALRLGATHDRHFAVRTPFVDKWKREVIALGNKLGVPYELTHTCYTGRRPACGLCDACSERIDAFKAGRMRDPLAYEITIDWPST